MSLPKQVYVTHYALTKGILLCTTNERWNRESSQYNIYVVWPGGSNGVAAFPRDDCHETLEQAQEHCAILIERKRKSLQKQLAKLDKFDPNKVKTVEGSDR